MMRSITTYTNRTLRTLVACLMIGPLSFHANLNGIDPAFVWGADTADDKLVEANKKLEIANAKLAAVQQELDRLKVGDKPEAIPLDLTDFYGTLAAKFDESTRYPAWKVVPRGKQTFLNVPLQIGGNLALWGQANTNNGQVFREEVKGIPVKRTFESLYIYHAAFHQSPDGTRVYDVVFNFSDGSSENEPILYGDDVRDWYYFPRTEAVPLDPRSKLAWHGYYSDENVVQPLRFCLTAIENPKPNLEVVSIDLVSCKENSAGCIMAITTGKAGLIP